MIIPPISHAIAALPLVEALSDHFNAMNACNWHIPTWLNDHDGTYVGRTQFRCTQNSPLPQVSGSNAIITVETYNPTSIPPNFSFYGTDLISNQLFALGQGLVVTVRAKMDTEQRGIVGGIFLYALKAGSNTLHDEIDFELLSNNTSEVWTNIYGNEALGAGHPMSHPYPSGNATVYHTYEIIWLPHQVTWSIDGEIVRTVTDQSLIPTGPMYFHLNMWVPDSGWAEAYCACLQPTDSPGSNQIFSMSVDSVNVQSYITPAIGIFRPGGNWYIDTNRDGVFSPGDAHQVELFGKSDGDIPVAIDWDGDGRQELAIFRAGTWFIDTNHDGIFSPCDIQLGPFGKQSGDIPVAIDWDGDNRQELAIFRPGGTWYIDVNRDGIYNAGDVQLGPFGKQAGDMPVAIDWNGDSRQELAIFRPGGTWFIDLNHNGIFNTGDVQLGAFGKLAGDIPVAIRGW